MLLLGVRPKAKCTWQITPVIGTSLQQAIRQKKGHNKQPWNAAEKPKRGKVTQRHHLCPYSDTKRSIVSGLEPEGGESQADAKRIQKRFEWTCVELSLKFCQRLFISFSQTYSFAIRDRDCPTLIAVSLALNGPDSSCGQKTTSTFTICPCTLKSNVRSSYAKWVTEK